MVVVFTSIFQIDKNKTTNNNKRKKKRKENVMNFEKVILWGARAIERARAKRECRLEAKLNKKWEHTKERERARIVRARAFYSLSWESYSSACNRERSLSLTLGKRTIGMRKREREWKGARAGVEDRRKSVREGGNVRIYYNYKTANKKWKKQKSSVRIDRC